MFRCLEMVLYETRESKEAIIKLKCFNALRWPYTRLTKVEKRGETEMFRCLEIAL